MRRTRGHDSEDAAGENAGAGKANPYRGKIDGWKVSLARRRARQLGFRSHEIDDALQELSLPIIRFRYQPYHRSGASEKTALCALIDRQLRALLRGQGRYGKHLQALRDGSAPLCPRSKHVPFASANFASPHQRLELQDALKDLSDEHHRVCFLLKQGQSIAQIAREMCCSWHRVNRLITSIRQHLVQRGITGVGR